MSSDSSIVLCCSCRSAHSSSEGSGSGVAPRRRSTRELKRTKFDDEIVQSGALPTKSPRKLLGPARPEDSASGNHTRGISLLSGHQTEDWGAEAIEEGALGTGDE